MNKKDNHEDLERKIMISTMSKCPVIEDFYFLDKDIEVKFKKGRTITDIDTILTDFKGNYILIENKNRYSHKSEYKARSQCHKYFNTFKQLCKQKGWTQPLSIYTFVYFAESNLFEYVKNGN